MLAGNWLHRARNTKPPFPGERVRTRNGAVNRFAALLDALLFTPSRNGKLRLMQEYFATTPDPERGWALAALTGELGFAEAKPSQVRDLAIARVDPELFGWSYDFVGDLAETVALIWPERDRPASNPHRILPASGGGSRPTVAHDAASQRTVSGEGSGSQSTPFADSEGRVGWGLARPMFQPSPRSSRS